MFRRSWSALTKKEHCGGLCLLCNQKAALVAPRCFRHSTDAAAQGGDAAKNQPPGHVGPLHSNTPSKWAHCLPTPLVATGSLCRLPLRWDGVGGMAALESICQGGRELLSTGFDWKRPISQNTSQGKAIAKAQQGLRYLWYHLQRGHTAGRVWPNAQDRKRLATNLFLWAQEYPQAQALQRCHQRRKKHFLPLLLQLFTLQYLWGCSKQQKSCASSTSCAEVQPLHTLKHPWYLQHTA